MIALAPTISHTLDTHRNDAASEMPCDMPSMQHDSSHNQPHAAQSSLDACAYCSLLAHMPAVLAPPVIFALVTQAIQHRIRARFRSAMLIEPPRPGRPRAPPGVPS
jgi:hypothetical protein